MGHRKPPRMCILTRKILPQENLLRIVCTPDNNILLDVSGNMLGRGMYVQKDERMIAQLFDPKKKGLWKHALKCDISEEDMQAIWKDIQKVFLQRL